MQSARDSVLRSAFHVERPFAASSFRSFERGDRREIEDLVADRDAGRCAAPSTFRPEHAERQVLDRKVAAGAFADSTQLASFGPCVAVRLR